MLEKRVTLPAWSAVRSINEMVCHRAEAQHGLNPGNHDAVKRDWEEFAASPEPLIDSIDFLLEAHRSAPFLFSNGNTFAAIGSTLVGREISCVSAAKVKIASKAVADYITGILDRDAMLTVIDEISRTWSFSVGDRVQTTGGSLHGVITQILQDGTLEWKPDHLETTMRGTPDSLKPSTKPVNP